MALWRDGTSGREGLVLSVQACGNASCPCRDVAIEGWVVTDQLAHVTFERQTIELIYDGEPRVPERKVLGVSVDVDTGKVTPNEKRSQRWALEWFSKECDAELLTSLRNQFDAAKRAASSPPFDWRTADWSTWVPGRAIGWRDLFEDDDEGVDVVVDGQTYVLGDTYCIEPGCSCVEVQVIVWHEDDRDGELTELGDVTLAPNALAGAQFHAHGAQRIRLQRVWEAWCGANRVEPLLHTRQATVRKLAPEFQSLIARRNAPRPRGAQTDRNAPCPCGSGKKFKKCCLGT